MLNDLNTIIDDVARVMTAAPADADLAQRIVLCVADGRRPRRAVVSRSWLLAPIGAALVMAAGLFFARGQQTVVVKRSVSRVAAAPSRGVVVSTPTALTPPSHPSPRRGTHSVRVEQSENARAVSASILPPIDVAPVDLERLDLAPLVRAEHIEIDPIAIARIEIAPMP
jgi:hypothetical protein